MAKKVLTIRAGETKILPKGSKIISTATTGIIATSNCPDVQAQLINAESYRCYTIGIGTPSDGGHTNVGDRLRFDGITVGGVRYPFTSSISFDGGDGVDHITTAFRLALTSVIAEILNISDLTGVFIGSCSNADTVDGGNGQMGYISFQSLPSVAEDGVMAIYGTSRGAGSNDYSYVQWTAVPRSAYKDQSVGPCACTGSI